ncbi:type 1 glutamine amidotransferase [Thermocrinis sp.]
MFKVGEHPLFYDFPKSLKVFQWHGDTFDLPAGAVRIYSSEKYENQAFVYRKAVGLQFHIEVDKSMVEEWARLYWNELEEEGIKEEALAWKEEYRINFTLLSNLLKRLI